MHVVYRLVRQAVGWTLLLIGLVAIVIPGFPQIPFLAAGALLLAPYVKIFRRVSAWFHKKFPRYRPHMRPFRVFKRPLRKSPPPFTTPST